jgi:hypothetical protein
MPRKETIRKAAQDKCAGKSPKARKAVRLRQRRPPAHGRGGDVDDAVRRSPAICREQPREKVIWESQIGST